jgi:hypothetical protein
MMIQLLWFAVGGSLGYVCGFMFGLWLGGRDLKHKPWTEHNDES